MSEEIFIGPTEYEVNEPTVSLRWATCTDDKGWISTKLQQRFLIKRMVGPYCTMAREEWRDVPVFPIDDERREP